MARTLAVCALLLRCLQTADALHLTQAREVQDRPSNTHWGNTHWGNMMAGVAWQLLVADQCGQRQPLVVPDLPGRREEVAHKGSSRFPYMDVFDQLFGLPLVSNNHETDCSLERLRDSTADIADFPPLNTTKLLFHRRLSPFLKGQQILARRRAELEDALVVHLRGGDILERADIDYLPAPCAFVDSVINTGRDGSAFEQIVMVSDSQDHPCIAYVKARHPQAHFEPHGIIEDLYTMMSAQSLALSTSSTFGLAAMLLNAGKDLRVFLPTYRGQKLCCEGNYQPARLSELCQIDNRSQIFEFNAPAHPWCSNRTDWIIQDANVRDVVVHKCS